MEVASVSSSSWNPEIKRLAASKTRRGSPWRRAKLIVKVNIPSPAIPSSRFLKYQKSQWGNSPATESRLRNAGRIGRNTAADIDKAPAHIVVVECPVERIGELVEDRLR